MNILYEKGVKQQKQRMEEAPMTPMTFTPQLVTRSKSFSSPVKVSGQTSSQDPALAKLASTLAAFTGLGLRPDFYNQ